MQIQLLILFGFLYIFGMAQPEHPRAGYLFVGKPVYCPGFHDPEDCENPKIVNGFILPQKWCQWAGGECHWNMQNLGSQYCNRKHPSACRRPFCSVDSTNQCQNLNAHCLGLTTAMACFGMHLHCRWYPVGATPDNLHFPVCGAP